MLRFEDFTNEKTETKEAPTKPKEKEKEKEKTPEKPSVDPFKRRPNVKPGEEPKPKAKSEMVLENKISSKEGMAFVTYKKTEDEMGYSVDFSFQGSVMEGDLPENWKQQMETALNEAEALIMKKLDWLQ